MKRFTTCARPGTFNLLGAVALGALLIAASVASADYGAQVAGMPSVKTSADTALAQKLDSTLRAAATAGTSTSIEVMVHVKQGSGAPTYLQNPVQIRLGVPTDSDVYVGSIAGARLTKLATSSSVIRVADNRRTEPPRLPDVPALDTAQTKAAAAKASARIAAATDAGITREWVESFDEQGVPIGAPNSDDPGNRGITAEPDEPAPTEKGGAAPTGWMDVGSTHGSSDAWDAGYTGDGVLVGVADSGVDLAHPDLMGTQATVADPASPYAGWPVAYDPYSLTRYASDIQNGTSLVADGTTWFSDTSDVVTRNGSGLATFDEVSYILPAVSVSGTYHLGYLNDDHLGEAGVIDGFAGGLAPILVTDEVTAGVYDTVRVDLNANEDFTDDKPCTKASPVSYLDYWDSDAAAVGSDGYADVSGGMVYWISDGSHHPPGYDLHFSGGAKPGSGNMVCFMGALDWFEDHGTLCASNVVAQGVIDGASVAGEYPSFKDPGTGGIVQGGGKDASLVAIGNVYAASNGYVMSYDFAARGLDGVAGTGDELQALSCSFGFSGIDNDEWDFESRYITKLNTTIAPTTTYLFSTGNGAPGYGTIAPPVPSTGVNVGASTQFGACGGWDSIHNADQVTVGDIIPWSNRGPTSMGNTGVDIVADGAYSSGALPLNTVYLTDHSDGWRAWEIWGGTSRSTPVVAGNLTLVQQAFKDREGRWPTWAEARSLLMSGAKDLSYDSFVQGAGMLDAARSVELAAGTGGLKVTPSAWSAGDFRGVAREAFANVMRPGDSDTATFEITNEGSASTLVSLSDAWHQRNWTTTMDITIDPAQLSPYDFSRPDKLVDISSMVPADTELLVVRTVYPLAEMDPTASFDSDAATKNDVRLLAYDWKDANGNHKLWTDSDTNGFVNGGEIETGEYERFTYGFGRGTSHEIRVQNPHERMHSGIFLGFQHRNRATGGGPVHIKVEISGWNRVDWPWLSTAVSDPTIPAHGSTTANATLNVPANAPVGVYDGQILVTQGTRTGVVPVSVNVAGSGAAMSFGGTSPYETLMDNTRIFGYQDWTWRAESGDWRFFSTDVPASPALPAGSRWLVHTSWDATPTDNDTLLYGPQGRSAGWPSGPDSVFGPYDLAYKGGSARTWLGAGRWAFGTTTGDAEEWASGPLSTGLNQVMIHNTLYSGANVGEGFTGTAGRVSSQPQSMKVLSGATGGSIPLTFSTSMSLPGLTATAAGLSQVQRHSAAISAGGWWYADFEVTNAPLFEVACACSTADIDLYVYRESGSSWELVGAAETSSGNETVKATRPTPGAYRVWVYGYSVPADNTPFTATVYAPQGTALSVTGAPAGALSAGSSANLTVKWTRPGSAPYPSNNLYRGVVLLGVPGAPDIIEVPFEITVDVTPPEAPYGLKSTVAYRSASLSWTNRSSDYAATRLYRSTTRHASSASDTSGQTKLFEKVATSHKDTSLVAGTRYYYTLFNRDKAGNWSVAAKTSVVPQGYAKLGRPRVSPSKPTHGKKFKVTGTISPKHASKTTVKLHFYRKVSNKYKLYKSVTVTVGKKAGSYSKTVKLSKKGSYYVKAYHADAAHAASYSSKRSFKVK